MKTVCVLIVSCPSIDHLTPRLPHLPATPVIIKWTIKNVLQTNILCRGSQILLNFRPVGQMSL